MSQIYLLYAALGPTSTTNAPSSFIGRANDFVFVSAFSGRPNRKPNNLKLILIA